MNTVQTALNDPQTRARGLVVEMNHPTAGVVRALGPLLRFGRTPASVRRPAPALGQHTDDILARVGVGAEELSRLRKAGAVQ
jgi:crotonobetainyl-CoA:carnitine CoA-transferase CaiB-like acyl-CoA transferase